MSKTEINPKGTIINSTFRETVFDDKSLGTLVIPVHLTLTLVGPNGVQVQFPG